MRKLLLFLFGAIGISSCNSDEFLIYDVILSGKREQIIEILKDTTQNNDLLVIHTPVDILLDINYRTQNKLTNDILTIKKERYSSHFSKHMIKVQSQEYKSASPELLEYLEFLKWDGNEIIKTEKDVKKILNTISQNKHKTAKDILYLSHYANILSNIFAERSQIEQSLATQYYLLHLLESHPLKQKLSNIKDNVLESILEITIRENNMVEYKSALDQNFNSLSIKKQNSFNGAMLKFHMAESFGNNAYSFMIKAQELAHAPEENHSINFNLGYYYSASNDSLEHIYLRKAIKAFDVCSIRRYYPAIYGLMGATTDIQKEYYESILNQAAACPNLINDKIRFALFNYVEPSMLELTENAQLDTLRSISSLAENLFPGKSTLHLQDYYITILSRFFQVVNRSQSKSEHIDVLVNQTLNTRIKEKFRTSLSNSTTNYSKIKHLLKELNYFKKLKPFSNPIYKELFFIFLDEEKKQVVNYKYEAIETNNLLLKLSDEKSNLINLVRCVDKYYAYILSDKKMNVISIPSEELDSLSTAWTIAIKQKLSTNKIVKEIKKLIPINLNKSEKFVIIPDGTFSLLPLQLLFNSSKITTYQNVSEYLNNTDSILIKPSKIKLYSYSDSLTIRNKEIKNVPELQISYKECSQIKNKLSDDIEIISGANLTQRILFNDIDVDLAHISSHAYSKTTNRLDNYILVRDSKTINSEKIYGYEIPLQSKIPKVIILSACDTGLGKYDAGAGVETLSRSLLNNGATTVIKTLWKVNEQATSQLMQKMYDEWKAGNSLYESLELAKKYLSAQPQYAHPYYWAGFVLEGNPNVFFITD